MIAPGGNGLPIDGTALLAHGFKRAAICYSTARPLSSHCSGKRRHGITGCGGVERYLSDGPELQQLRNNAGSAGESIDSGRLTFRSRRR